MFVIESPFTRVQSVAFSSDGRLAAIPGETEWECEVWSIPPDPATTWHDYDGEPYAFGLVIDPRTGDLIHGDAKEGLVFNNPEQDLRGIEVPGGPLRTFAISPKGDWFVCGCQLWDALTKKHFVPAQLIGYSRTAKQKSWKQSAVLDGEGFVYSSVAFLPDGKRFASLEWSRRKRGQEHTQGTVPTLNIHDAKTLAVLDSTQFKAPAEEVVGCGSFVLVRGEKSFRVWDASDLSTSPHEVKTGRNKLTSFAADPLGRFAVTAVGEDVTIWDSDQWQAGKTYTWDKGKITCLAVSPDGLLLAAGTATGKIIVWDAE